MTYNKKHDHSFGPGDVWRSLDGGRSWQTVVRHGRYWRDNEDHGYWVQRNNPTAPNMRFGHLQRAIDDGDESEGNRLLAMDCKGNIFVSVDQQVLRSTDKGESWQQIDDLDVGDGSWVGRGDSNLPGRFMLLATGIPGRRLLASEEHGLWQTTDITGWPRNPTVVVKQLEGQINSDGMHSISTVAVRVRPH